MATSTGCHSSAFSLEALLEQQHLAASVQAVMAPAVLVLSQSVGVDDPGRSSWEVEEDHSKLHNAVILTIEVVLA